MEAPLIIPDLHGLAVVLGVDNEDFLPHPEEDVCLHTRQEADHRGFLFTGKIPLHLPRLHLIQVGMVAAVVFQDKALIEFGHLVIGEGHEAVVPLVRGLDHPIQNEVANIDEELIASIISKVLEPGPGDFRRIHQINLVEENKDFPECPLPLNVNPLIPDQVMEGGLQDLIIEVVFRQLIKSASQVLPPLDPIPDGSGDIQLPPHDRKILFFANILPVEPLLDLPSQALGKDGCKEVLGMVKGLGGQAIIVGILENLEGIGKHIVDVFYEDGLILSHQRHHAG